MTKKLILLTFCITLLAKGNAQYLSMLEGKIEAGISFGASNFLGDLGGNKGKGKTFLKDNNVELTKAYKGVFVTYYPKEWIGIRLAANQMMVEGNDAIIEDQGGAEMNRKIRNLSFRSNIVEAVSIVEFMPTVPFEEDLGYLSGKFRPILFAGVGVFKYNPQTLLNGSWVDLRPLHTEGQGFPEYPERKEYKKTALNFPFGIGLRYYINETTCIGFEAIHRFTNTDYIDDVSTRFIKPAEFDLNLPAPQAALAKQLYNRTLPTTTNIGKPGSIRGDPTEKDGYYTTTIKIGFRIGGAEDRYNRKLRRQVRCYR